MYVYSIDNKEKKKKKKKSGINRRAHTELSLLPVLPPIEVGATRRYNRLE
jgi:hypothetical protein